MTVEQPDPNTMTSLTNSRVPIVGTLEDRRTAYDVDRQMLVELLFDQPSYRVDQIWHGLYRDAVLPRELTTLPKSLRRKLVHELPAALSLVAEATSDHGQTVKWLWEIDGAKRIETVLMYYEERSTVCISTQAGCAMACGFCATGQAGFDRQLSPGEIIEQVMRSLIRARSDRRRVSNVVFMGMGEPLANYDAVWTALRRLNTDVGISARHLTLSTVGIVPGIRRMADEDLPVNLAISLHAANDELRSSLVPINRKYPLSELADACRLYLASKNRRISFEWALMDNINDTKRDAEELAAFVRPLNAHVNLIPLNPTPGYPTPGSPPEKVDLFKEQLSKLGVNVTVRQNRGSDIDAACGQLSARSGKL